MRRSNGRTSTTIPATIVWHPAGTRIKSWGSGVETPRARKRRLLAVLDRRPTYGLRPRLDQDADA